MSSPKKKRHVKTPRHPKISEDMIDARVWYALRVISQKEFLAQEILRRLGLFTYVPVRKEWRHKNRYAKARRENKVLMSYPETVGYVFIGFTPNQLTPENIPHWMKLFNLTCVTGAVGINGEPKQINKDALKRLAKTFPNGVQKPEHEAYMRTHREYQVGDNVVICEGPFQGQVVPVVELNEGHAIVKLELFGSIRDMTFDAFDLEKFVA